MSDLHERLVRWCPRLTTSDYVETSQARRRCNCFAWAAGDTERNWYPKGDPDLSYWPRNARNDFTVDAFVDAYATVGFARCDDGTLQPGVEKIALYVDADGEPSHAARQLVDGHWESKMGTWEDIRHHGTACLEGGDYGTVKLYLARPRTP
jgi:hypothetical protein